MKHLTIERRYEISILQKRGVSQKEIAKEVGISESTISRELLRNTTKQGKYNASTAQMFSQERKERFGIKRKFTKAIEQQIRTFIEQEQWSPEQIVGYCKKQNLEMVSVERIYQFIRQDKESGGELFKHLRHKLKHRKQPVSKDKSRIIDGISIEQIPEKVNNR